MCCENRESKSYGEKKGSNKITIRNNFSFSIKKSITLLKDSITVCILLSIDLSTLLKITMQQQLCLLLWVHYN